jgi:hypothetical protein
MSTRLDMNMNPVLDLRLQSDDPENLAGEATVPIDDFEQLLQKLEASKMRQQRQQSVEGRRDIYSQGLASMMRNF